MGKKERIYVAVVIWLAAVCLAGWGVYWVSAAAFWVILADLLPGVGIFLAAFTIGYLPSRLLGGKFSLAERLILALALGVGLLAIVVLLCGLAGLFSALFWRAFVAVLAFAGFGILYYHLRSGDAEEVVFEWGRWWSLLVLVVVPFLILAAVCATIPAGLIWSAEGYGYDVLEYHLQVPKEWFHAGGIMFLPHNVYANFPFSAEMLYLLAMMLYQDPHDAIYLCQLLHFGWAIAFVAAVWVFCRAWGPLPASFAAMAAGTCPWLMYLAPLAYVEAPMLFVAAVAVGALTRALWSSMLNLRISILIGLLLGMVGGYKYTGLAMLGPGVLLVTVLAVIPTFRLKPILVYPTVMILSVLAAISPWLVRNYCWTGNPVFPLAYRYFGGGDWDEELAERWEKGHSARSDQQKLTARASALYWCGLRNIAVDHLLAEKYRASGQFDRAKEILHPRPLQDLPRFGLAILLLPWIVLFTRRQRFIDYLLVLILVGQTMVWLFATHLQARFLVPWLAVLPFLIGRSASAVTFRKGLFRPAVLALVLIGAAGINFYDCYLRYLRHVYFGGRRVELFGAHRSLVEGQIPGYEYLAIVNRKPTSRILLIGDARPFYIKGPAIYWTVFNRNEFAAQLTGRRTLRDLKDYLAQIRPDFIYVDWSEIVRLSRTYGFDESVRPRIFGHLSSPSRFVIKRIGAWGPKVTYQGSQTPARVLYELKYPEKKPTKIGRKAKIKKRPDRKKRRSRR